jgi:hypothetical protein
MTGGAIRRAALTACALAASATLLSADTLYLRDGQRVEGRLLSVQAGTIEFRQGTGWGARTVRFDVRDVRRIEFDDYQADYGNPADRHEGGGGRRPSGMREREVVVSADEAWNDTGIDIHGNATIYFEARGEVTWGRGRKDGPEGEKNSPHNPGRPIPNRPGASLIGKVGANSQDYFFIGDNRGPIRVRGTGRLFLGINDDVLLDNTGNFRVAVYY